MEEQNNARSLSDAWESSMRNSRSLLIAFLLVGTLFASNGVQTAHAQIQFPPWCSPVGTIPCSSMIPKEILYIDRETCSGHPPKRSESASKQDIVIDYTRPDNCSLSVTANGTWLTGGPWTIGYCGGLLNYTTLPQIDPATGIEVANYKLFNVDWTQGASCSAFHAEGAIARVREINCPRGMLPSSYGTVTYQGTQYSGRYCAGNAGTGLSAVLLTKNLGRCKDCASTVGNPIHIQTGNCAANHLLRDGMMA